MPTCLHTHAPLHMHVHTPSGVLLRRLGVPACALSAACAPTPGRVNMRSQRCFGAVLSLSPGTDKSPSDDLTYF